MKTKIIKEIAEWLIGGWFRDSDVEHRVAAIYCYNRMIRAEIERGYVIKQTMN